MIRCLRQALRVFSKEVMMQNTADEQQLIRIYRRIAQYAIAIRTMDTESIRQTLHRPSLASQFRADQRSDVKIFMGHKNQVLIDNVVFLLQRYDFFLKLANFSHIFLSFCTIVAQSITK